LSATGGNRKSYKKAAEYDPYPVQLHRVTRKNIVTFGLRYTEERILLDQGFSSEASRLASKQLSQAFSLSERVLGGDAICQENGAATYYEL
jgi:hypothetical protein